MKRFHWWWSPAWGHILSTYLFCHFIKYLPWIKEVGYMKYSDSGMYGKTKRTKPASEELNKVSPLITRGWTGLRQEKPWPLAGSRCGGPKGGALSPTRPPSREQTGRPCCHSLRRSLCLATLSSRSQRQNPNTAKNIHHQQSYYIHKQRKQLQTEWNTFTFLQSKMFLSNVIFLMPVEWCLVCQGRLLKFVPNKSMKQSK